MGGVDGKEKPVNERQVGIPLFFLGPLLCSCPMLFAVANWSHLVMWIIKREIPEREESEKYLLRASKRRRGREERESTKRRLEVVDG